MQEASHQSSRDTNHFSSLASSESLTRSDFGVVKIPGVPATFGATTASVHVAGLAADEGLIDFNFAGELVEKVAILHCEPDLLWG